MRIADFLIEKKLCIDYSEAKRLLTQAEISVNGERIDCWVHTLNHGDVITFRTKNRFKVFSFYS